VPKTAKTQRVVLFPTCLVSFFRPSVARAAAKLLAEAGFTPETPAAATCCGQPNLNGGDLEGARAIARRQIATLAGFDYVVVPSGSCAGTLINQYPALFPRGSEDEAAARALAAKTFELTAFLARVAKWNGKRQTIAGAVTLQDSCSCRRELKVIDDPRHLLASAGAAVAEAADPDRCCGFGGMFSVKFGEISAHLAGEKCKALTEAGAATIVGGDLGCLLNLAGKLAADGSAVDVRHIAEVLAGETATPAIGKERA
jgi:L-lactate dehydrogenase complex protein LldE